MIASDSFVKYFCAFFPFFFRIYSNTLFLFSFFTAVQIWLMTAFSLVPMKLLIFRFCLIFLKKSSICQRSLYSAAICSGFKSISLVRKLNQRSLSVSCH